MNKLWRDLCEGDEDEGTLGHSWMGNLERWRAQDTFAVEEDVEVEGAGSVGDAVAAVAAVSAIGGTPAIRAANGGLDANWMVRHGVSTVTFGAGQNEPHTIDEWINLDEYDRACVLAVQLATMR